MVRSALILLGPLSIVARAQFAAIYEGCPDLRGKDPAAHVEYLRGDRSKLAPKCIVAALRYVGGKSHAPGGPVLVQYLDYHNPDPTAQRVFLETYPAVDALCAFGKPAVPDLVAAIANADTSDLARRNAAWVMLFLYGANEPEGIAVLVSAAHAETDPIASNRLMDQARWFASRCPMSSRNDCENAVLK
jgi:hypothetical protein